MGHIKSANIRPFVFIHLESDLHQKLNISGVVCKQCLLKLCKDPHISFWYILLTKLTAHRQTRRHNRAYNQPPFDSWQRSLYEVNLPLSRSVANSHRPLQSTVNRSLKVQQGGTSPINGKCTNVMTYEAQRQWCGASAFLPIPILLCLADLPSFIFDPSVFTRMLPRMGLHEQTSSLSVLYAHAVACGTSLMQIFFDNVYSSSPLSFLASCTRY